jgi:hypothetical protein
LFIDTYCGFAQFDMNMQAFGSAHSGCSDTQCSGFVQVTQDKRYFVGSVQSPATRIGEPFKKFLGVKIQRVNILRNIKIDTYIIILYLRHLIKNDSVYKIILCNIIFN